MDAILYLVFSLFSTIYEKLSVVKIPQVNLNTIIRKINSNNRLNLFRNIDFGIFDKELKEILLLIELNDKTHELPERKRRDYAVKEICKKANIKLLIFYVENKNEKNFVLNLIKETINNK